MVHRWFVETQLIYVYRASYPVTLPNTFINSRCVCASWDFLRTGWCLLKTRTLLLLYFQSRCLFSFFLLVCMGQNLVCSVEHFPHQKMPTILFSQSRFLYSELKFDVLNKAFLSIQSEFFLFLNVSVTDYLYIIII